MKKLILIYISLIISTLSAQNNLIFGGGQDDGYSVGQYAQPDHNAIFQGGDDDGYAQDDFSQKDNNPIFGGGIDDGYSRGQFAQQDNNTIFGGGDDDGYANIYFGQKDNNAIFGGGADDGYSEKSYAQRSNNSIFMGGDDDGYVCFYLETATPLRLPPILAVDWLIFDARAIDSKVQLTWETAREVNHQFFQIERSSDLLNIETVSEEIAAEGSPDAGSQYQHWDVTPYGGTSFYRVKAVDNNGELSYTEWREIRFGDQDIFSFTAFPNPVHHILTARINTTEAVDVNIRLTDLQGRTLWSTQRSVPVGETKLPIQVGSFTEGLYFLEIFAKEGKHKTVRILKLN